ncbi:MAG: class I SAM-dependent methyltransferase, partial [Anaerolineae bacterium]
MQEPDSIYGQPRYAEIYDLESQWKTDDIDYWVRLASEYAGNDGAALELGCGTGRVLVPLAENGLRVTGIDESPFMLAQARAKCDRLTAEARTRVALLEGDMRAFQSDQKFNLVYIPFNSFLLMRTVADQLAVFDAVRGVLAPGGVFAFDIFMPDVKRLAHSANQPQWEPEMDETLGDLGIRLQRESMVVYSLYNQQIQATFRHRMYIDDSLQQEWVSNLHLSYLFPRELEHLVVRAGFELVHFWGDYDRQSFWRMREPGKMLPVM